MESPQPFDSEFEVNNYNSKRNAAAFDWKTSVLNSPAWSEATTTSSLSCSPEQDNVELNEKHFTAQSYQTRINDIKFTAMRLLIEDSVCVYCGVHVNNNESSDQNVCTLCSDILYSNRLNNKLKRHGIQFMSLQPDECWSCRQLVNDFCVEALEYCRHPHHFTCTYCRSTITEHIDRKIILYCERNFENISGMHCKKCTLPIFEDHIAALDTTWHINCFTCQECTIVTPACHSLNKKLLCESHYYSHHQLICQLCDGPLKFKYLSSRTSKFHPHHFNRHSRKDPLDGHVKIKKDILFCSHCLPSPQKS